MITHSEAERIAARVIGLPADDTEHGWDLDEFDKGWIIIERGWEDYRGGVTRVIERESGRVMRFPSFLPPDRIVADYAEALSAGRPEDV
jgi:hypothetical protein